MLTLTARAAPQAHVAEGELERADALAGLWGGFAAALDGVPARLRALPS